MADRQSPAPGLLGRGRFRAGGIRLQSGAERGGVGGGEGQPEERPPTQDGNLGRSPTSPTHDPPISRCPDVTGARSDTAWARRSLGTATRARARRCRPGVALPPSCTWNTPGRVSSASPSSSPVSASPVSSAWPSSPSSSLSSSQVESQFGSSMLERQNPLSTERKVKEEEARRRGGARSRPPLSFRRYAGYPATLGAGREAVPGRRQSLEVVHRDPCPPPSPGRLRAAPSREEDGGRLLPSPAESEGCWVLVSNLG